jgi:hypothetical protein
MVKLNRIPPALIGGRVQVEWRSGYTEASSVSQGMGNQRPMLEDASRFSGKIMFEQRDEASFSFNLMKS